MTVILGEFCCSSEHFWFCTHEFPNNRYPTSTEHVLCVKASLFLIQQLSAQSGRELLIRYSTMNIL